MSTRREEARNSWRDLMNDWGPAAPWLYFVDPTAFQRLRRSFLRAQLEILDGFSDIVRDQLGDLERDETPKSEKIIIE